MTPIAQPSTTYRNRRRSTLVRSRGSELAVRCIHNQCSNQTGKPTSAVAPHNETVSRT